MNQRSRRSPPYKPGVHARNRSLAPSQNTYKDQIPTIESDLLDRIHTGSRQSGGTWINTLTHLRREVHICHEFIKYDYTTGLVPPVLFVVAVAVHYHLSLAEFTVAAVKGLALFLGYIYSFCLSNQLAGITEDRINKPNRPIPTGLVTPDQAWSRLVFVLVIYATLGLWFQVAWWVLLWQAALILHNQGRWSWHWSGKNMIMGVGTLAQLSAAWGIVAPISSTGWRWILTLSAIIFSLIPLQDLRDIHGDLAGGRRTFPVVFGCRFTRAYLVVGFGLLPLVVHQLLIRPAATVPWAVVVDLVLCAWAWTIAARTICWRTPRADHWTYTLWTYWYTAILASGVIIL
jgi:4-hydroxybenzoate polyprenyltransferase